MQQGGAGHRVWGWGGGRRGSGCALIVHAEGDSLHQGLRARGVRGCDGRFKHGERSGR